MMKNSKNTENTLNLKIINQKEKKSQNTEFTQNIKMINQKKLKIPIHKLGKNQIKNSKNPENT